MMSPTVHGKKYLRCRDHPKPVPATRTKRPAEEKKGQREGGQEE